MALEQYENCRAHVTKCHEDPNVTMDYSTMSNCIGQLIMVYLEHPHLKNNWHTCISEKSYEKAFAQLKDILPRYYITKMDLLF